VAISAGAVKELREKTGAGMMDCKRALSDADGSPEKAIELLRERGLAKAVKRAGRETSEGTIAIALDGANAGIIELGCETDFVAKTDDFQALATSVVAAAAANPAADTPETLLAVSADGETLGERIQTAVGKLGENIELKQVARIAGSGSGQTGGYVHAGGKLGVIVGLATEGDEAKAVALAKDIAMHVAAHDPSPLAIDRDSVDKDLLDKEAEIYRKQAEQDGKPEKVIERIVEGRIKKYYAEVCLLEQSFVKDPDQTIQQLVAAAGKDLGSPVELTGFVRFRLGDDSGA
jgi:elongation factor Ts